MKEHWVALFCTLALLAGSVANLFGQGGQPPQPKIPQLKLRQHPPPLLRLRFQHRKPKHSQTDKR